MRISEILTEMKCWDGYRKAGTQPGTGKNKGKRVNKCVPEGLDADQKRVGQVGGKEKAKKIGTVLGTAPKQHPFKGRLVGEDIDSNVRTEHYNGIEISFEKEDDEIIVTAMMPGGRELGHVLFVQEGDYLMPQDLEVDERYQGQGIAATMYDYVKSKGYKIRRSGQQTDAGAGFWDKHKPGKNVWEQRVEEGYGKYYCSTDKRWKERKGPKQTRSS